MAAVLDDNNKYGYINTEGDLIIPCKYSSASSFNKGISEVKENDQYYYIDKSGKTICQQKEETIENAYYKFFRIYNSISPIISFLVAIVIAFIVSYYCYKKNIRNGLLLFGSGCIGFIISFIAIFFIISFLGKLLIPADVKERLETENYVSDSINKVKKEEKEAIDKEERNQYAAYREARRYLVNNLRDPNSYDEIDYNCVYVDKFIYNVTIRYRARNGFGGMNVEESIFRVYVNGSAVSVIEKVN